MEMHDDREENHKDAAANGISEKDLVSGVCDHVVLEEIIPRLSRATPRDKRPVLSLLSRSWANAMARHSPLLSDRAYNPSACFSSREFIVSRFIKPENSLYDTDASVWVWDFFRGSKTTLPPPPIPNVSPLPNVLKRFNAKFVCDGESVYVLNPATETEEQSLAVYDVWMLDLREFNIRWKKLPSLPRLGKHVYASRYGGESYVWQRRQILSSEADGWKLSGSGENDSKWHWQHINVNTPPPQDLNFDKSDRLPLYIEITEGPEKRLYSRCPLPSMWIDGSASIFMFPNLDGDDNQPIICGDLYYLEVDKNQNGGVCLLKAELDSVKTTTVQESEWGDFVEDWHTDIYMMNISMQIWEELRRYDNYPKWPNHDQVFASAIKVFRPMSPMCPWKIQQKIKFENCMDKFFYEFNVSHSGPIYGYKFMAKKL